MNSLVYYAIMFCFFIEYFLVTMSEPPLKKKRTILDFFTGKGNILNSKGTQLYSFVVFWSF